MAGTSLPDLLKFDEDETGASGRRRAAALLSETKKEKKRKKAFTLSDAYKLHAATGVLADAPADDFKFPVAVSLSSATLPGVKTQPMSASTGQLPSAHHHAPVAESEPAPLPPPPPPPPKFNASEQLLTLAFDSDNDADADYYNDDDDDLQVDDDDDKGKKTTANDDDDDDDDDDGDHNGSRKQRSSRSQAAAASDAQQTDDEKYLDIVTYTERLLRQRHECSSAGDCPVRLSTDEDLTLFLNPSQEIQPFQQEQIQPKEIQPFQQEQIQPKEIQPSQQEPFQQEQIQPSQPTEDIQPEKQRRTERRRGEPWQARNDGEVVGVVELVNSQTLVLLALSVEVRGVESISIGGHAEHLITSTRSFVLETPAEDELQPGTHQFPFRCSLALAAAPRLVDDAQSKQVRRAPPIATLCVDSPRALAVPSFHVGLPAATATAVAVPAGHACVYYVAWAAAIVCQPGEQGEHVLHGRQTLLPVAVSCEQYLVERYFRYASVEKTLSSLFTSGNLNASVALSKSLYYPGERCDVNVQVINFSSLTVRAVTVSFVATARLSHRSVPASGPTSAEYRDVLVDNEPLLPTLPVGDISATVHWRIPCGLRPSVADAALFSYDYQLVVRIATDAMFSSELDFCFPVTVAPRSVFRHPRMRQHASCTPPAPPPPLFVQTAATTAASSKQQVSEAKPKSPPAVVRRPSREVNGFLAPSYPHLMINGTRSALLETGAPLRGSVSFNASFLFHADLSARRPVKVVVSARSVNQRDFSLKAQYHSPPSTFSSSALRSRDVQGRQLITLSPYTTPPLSDGRLFVQVSGRSFFDSCLFVLSLRVEELQPVKPAASAAATSAASAVVQEILFENERRLSPFSSFEASHLFGDDPPHWSDSLGVAVCPPSDIQLPPGWRWKSNWQQSEWRYATFFNTFFRGDTSYPESFPTAMVRRRSWTRCRTAHSVESDSSSDDDTELAELLGDFEIVGKDTTPAANPTRTLSDPATIPSKRATTSLSSSSSSSSSHSSSSHSSSSSSASSHSASSTSSSSSSASSLSTPTSLTTSPASFHSPSSNSPSSPSSASLSASSPSLSGSFSSPSPSPVAASSSLLSLSSLPAAQPGFALPEVKFERAFAEYRDAAHRRKQEQMALLVEEQLLLQDKKRLRQAEHQKRRDELDKIEAEFARQAAAIDEQINAFVAARADNTTIKTILDKQQRVTPSLGLVHSSSSRHTPVQQEDVLAAFQPIESDDEEQSISDVDDNQPIDQPIDNQTIDNPANDTSN